MSEVGKLQMTRRRVFGLSSRAQLNQALYDALRRSMPSCEDCLDIEKLVEEVKEGGEYVEAASFPGKTVEKVDAHFRFHWKDNYELIDLTSRKASP